MSKLPWEMCEKKICFMYCPLEIWALKIGDHDIEESNTASSLKLGKMTEDYE